MQKSKCAFALVALWAQLVLGQNDKTPARKYHDAEKDRATQLTQIAVDKKQNIWALRNGSEWYLNSVSFLCDTNESNDERFIYARADGSLIPPWEEKRPIKGKDAPWGSAMPGTDEVVRHVSGVRQDLLGTDEVAWYIQKYRIFNCRVTDVELDHKATKKPVKAKR